MNSKQKIQLLKKIRAYIIENSSQYIIENYHHYLPSIIENLLETELTYLNIDYLFKDLYLIEYWIIPNSNLLRLVDDAIKKIENIKETT